MIVAWMMSPNVSQLVAEVYVMLVAFVVDERYLLAAMRVIDELKLMAMIWPALHLYNVHHTISIKSNTFI